MKNKTSPAIILAVIILGLILAILYLLIGNITSMGRRGESEEGRTSSVFLETIKDKAGEMLYEDPETAEEEIRLEDETESLPQVDRRGGELPISGKKRK